jgi:hypothetical protein
VPKNHGRLHYNRSAVLLGVGTQVLTADPYIASAGLLEIRGVGIGTRTFQGDSVNFYDPTGQMMAPPGPDPNIGRGSVWAGIELRVTDQEGRPVPFPTAKNNGRNVRGQETGFLATALSPGQSTELVVECGFSR